MAILAIHRIEKPGYFSYYATVAIYIGYCSYKDLIAKIAPNSLSMAMAAMMQYHTFMINPNVNYFLEKRESVIRPLKYCTHK